MASMNSVVMIHEFYNKGHDYYYSKIEEPYDESWKRVGTLGFVYERAISDDVKACYEFGSAGDHYYSTNPQPYDANWGLRRTLGYVLTEEKEGSSAVWEFYSGTFNCHYYSTDTESREGDFKKGEKPVFWIPNGRTDELYLWLQQKEIESLYPTLRSYEIVDLETLQLLEPTDPEFIKLPLVPRKRLLRALKVLQSQHNGPTITEDEQNKYKYDLFLSHKQINGADTVQAIKLQIERLRPVIRSFLDVDDLNVIHGLEDNVKNSRNFLLLLTEGVLERPYVQLEIRTALAQKKNIILVHDERSCPFPKWDSVPEDIRPVLMIKAIPYIRENAFRKVCINLILNAMV